MNKISIWLIVGTILLTILLIGLKKAGVIGPDKTIKVAVEKVLPRTIVETVNATGKIFPEKELKLGPDAGGEITELNVNEGDTVKKGQVLARITGHSVNIMQQPSETHSTVVAPMDGIISFLYAKKGERVASTTTMVGGEMMRVADFKNFELRVDVAENDIPKVVVGDSAFLTIDAFSDIKMTGVVTQVANSPNGQTLGAANDVTNYKVSIHILTNKNKEGITLNKLVFRPGMTGSADIQTKTKQNVLAVPINSVTSRSNMENVKPDSDKNDATVYPADEQIVVFVYQPEGTVKTAVVKTGLQDTKYIEITNGLKGGEQVVSDPYTVISTILKDGIKVKVVPKNKLFTEGKN